MLDREQRRWSFDGFPERYLDGRPRYPDGVFDALLEAADLAPGERALEVGCGPGISTRQLAERGVPILAVELGPHLAEVARGYLREFPGVEIVAHDFNTWSAPEAAFGLVYASQAWQWVDPETGFAKAHRALRPGGVLAPFWNYPVVRAAFLNPAYAAHAPDVAITTPAPTIEARIAERAEALRTPGLFEDIEIKRFPWTMRRDADAYIRLLDTYSDHVALDAPVKQALFADIHARIEAQGGVLEQPMEAVVYLCRRQD